LAGRDGNGFDPNTMIEFGDDPETETVEVTEEVAKRFASRLPVPPPPPKLTDSRETLLPADLREAFKNLAPRDRDALLDAIGKDISPANLPRTETLTPATPEMLRTMLGPDLDAEVLFKESPVEEALEFYDSPSGVETQPDTQSSPPQTTADDSEQGIVQLADETIQAPAVATPASQQEKDANKSTMVWIDNSSGPGAGADATPETLRERRFVDLGLLGVGGMGEVRRVFDRTLKRVLAVKVIRRELAGDSRIVSRFIAEAQATGQLQHPSIVPVHEVGRFADGRYYFTMREVRGQDLGKVINAYHKARREGPDSTDHGEQRWTLRRLVDAFLKVCEAVGYAHSRNVIHRDLKPENILVGEFGEVLVVDWGIAKVLNSGKAEEDSGAASIITSRSQDDSKKTMIGSVAGTPSYMPIEQAAGDREAQGPHSDVYALGAILYEILGSKAPYAGRSGNAILRALLEGPPDPLPEDPSIPEALRQVCMRAMQRQSRDRYSTGRELSAVISSWLDGAQRREAALELLTRAESKRDELDRLRRRSSALREDAEAMLDDTPVFAPAAEKEPAWTSIDRADRLERGAEMLEVTLTHNARAALERFPELDEAHALLADVYKERHERAERAGEAQEAERELLMLRSHHRGRFEEYLQGDGALTLVTDPPGAKVQIFRYVKRGRRLVLRAVGEPHTSPIIKLQLPMGSYLVSIESYRRIPVRYPVHIGRGEHWDGVPPGGTEPHPIYLPKTYEIIEGDVYVPAGWFTAGGDPSAPNAAARQRVWADGFFMQSHPVTNAEYFEFID